MRTLAFAVGTLAGFASLASAVDVAQIAPTSVPVASGPGPQLAGSSTCRECHAPFYEKWAPSHHGLAMLPFTADLATQQLKPLSDPITVRDCRYRVEFVGEKGWVMESGPKGEKRYALEHALEPQEPKFTCTLAFYLHARGARDEAVTLLRTGTDRRTAHLDAYMLLGRIYEEGGQEDDAIELYQRGATMEQFPGEVRQQFGSRAQWLSQRR